MAKASWISPDYPVETYDGPPRNIAYIDQLAFDPSLQPVNYEISGTDPTAKVLILDVDILEATGREPYRGDVLITGRSHDLNFWDPKTNGAILPFRAKVHACGQCSKQANSSCGHQCACLLWKRSHLDARLGRCACPFYLERGRP